MKNDRERRAVDRERNAFETLVLVRPQAGKETVKEGAYECEAMDLSTHGMRLRTAYLPALGQELRCRFDVTGEEVDATGQVVWRQERAKGGEFGVSFTKLTGPGAKAVRELIAEDDNESAALTVPRLASEKGKRVRLHIEGLGSPLRARVRDAETGKILVGSQLEFLRVGKRLDLEDIARAKTRSALVEQVSVEMEPTSQVPQLVVKLRYEKPGEESLNGQASSEKTTPFGLDASPAPVTIGRMETNREIGDGFASVSNREDQEPSEPILPGATKAPGTWDDRLRHAVQSIEQGLATVWATTQQTVSHRIADLTDRRGTRSDTPPPRRTTTVPPLDNAALGGRHRTQSVVEDEDVGDVALADDADTARKKKFRRYALVGGVGVTLAVVSAFALRDQGEPPPGTEGSTDVATARSAPGESSPGLAATTAPSNAPPLPSSIASDAVSANVPLFGTTALSTTEPIAPPAPTANFPLTAAPADPPTLTAGEGTTSSGENDASSPSHGASAGPTTYGRGKVRNPHTVRLKMDSSVQSLKGSVTEGSLTVTVPGRHNIEPAAPLSKRDKRIVAVKATPNGHGTDVTIVFRDHVPPFLAKANGKMLEIDLGDTSATTEAEDGQGRTKRQAKKAISAEHGTHGHNRHGDARAHGKEKSGHPASKGKHGEKDGHGKR